MKIETDLKLDFSDVLFRPKRSTLNSRKDVDIQREFSFKESGRKWSGVPLIASNMDTIGTADMFKALSAYKIITCLHKFIDIHEIINICKEDTQRQSYFAISTGITPNDLESLDKKINACSEEGVDVSFICVDVANGYMSRLVDVCKLITPEDNHEVTF